MVLLELHEYFVFLGLYQVVCVASILSLLVLSIYWRDHIRSLFLRGGYLSRIAVAIPLLCLLAKHMLRVLSPWLRLLVLGVASSCWIHVRLERIRFRLFSVEHNVLMLLDGIRVDRFDEACLHRRHLKITILPLFLMDLVLKFTRQSATALIHVLRDLLLHVRRLVYLLMPIEFVVLLVERGSLLGERRLNILVQDRGGGWEGSRNERSRVCTQLRSLLL